MAYLDYLKDILRPLGVYDLDEGAGAGEIYAIANMLDGIDLLTEALEKEVNIRTASDFGISSYENMLPFSASFSDIENRRRSICALLAVNDASFTLEKINAALSGCGINAEARETDTMFCVTVHFVNYNGIPYDLEKADEIISKIMPSHVAYEYVFSYPLWSELIHMGTFGELEKAKMTWNDMEHWVA